MLVDANLKRPEIARQKEFYEERWRTYGFANRLKLARAVAILEGIAATKIFEPKIVDLGCGTGWLAGMLGNFGPTTAVDLSEIAVEAAAKRHSNVQFLQADIFAWDHPEGQYDIVISQEVIEHVEDQRAYLEIACKMLRPGGYLILTTPNAETLNAMTEEQRDSWQRQPIENWLTKGELKTLLRRRFQTIRVTTLILGYGVRGTYVLANSNRLRSLLEKAGAARFFDNLRSGLGYGLHLYALARKI